MSEWISVEDELPSKKTGPSMIVWDGKEMDDDPWYCQETHRWMNGEYTCGEFDQWVPYVGLTITHWMPLPEAPHE